MLLDSQSKLVILFHVTRLSKLAVDYFYVTLSPMSWWLYFMLLECLNKMLIWFCVTRLLEYNVDFGLC